MRGLIDDLKHLRDGQDDELGRLLDRAVRALRTGARVRHALAVLVDAHDETPSMLTEDEWKVARTVLGRRVKRGGRAR
jgi:hypothetical protein